MKKIIIILAITFMLAASAQALNCMQPVKPLLPLKPYWCNGTWTQVLQCDQYCNCQWVPMCIE